MKFIITISISFFIYYTTLAQLKGTTQVGRLIPLKQEVEIIDNSPPVITLM